MGKSAVEKQKRGRRHQQDLGLVDRWLLWMQNNQKVLLVILLLLIAPIFFLPAFSLQSIFGDRSVPRMTVDGQVVYQDEINTVKDTVDAVMGFRGRPDFRDPKAIGRWFTLASLTGVELAILEREADQKGLVVSGPELGSELRRVYRQLKLATESRENSLARQLDPATPQFNYQEREDELEAQNPWNFQEWRGLLKEFVGNSSVVPPSLSQPKHFEVALRRVLRLEKLIDFVMDTVDVGEDIVREAYVRDQQFRKFSFFWLVPSEEELAKGGEEIQEEDIEKFFNDDPNFFRVSRAVGRVDYLYLPFSEFEDKVEISDEDLQKEYEASRDTKFRLLLTEEDPGVFELRTAKEEKERESKLYKSLDEVREEVTEALSKKKTERLARTFGNELRRRVFPANQDEEGVSFTELVKEHPSLTAGTTRMIESRETQRELGMYHARSIESAFSTLTKNANEPDESLHNRVSVSKLFTVTTDKSGLVLYNNFQYRLPGDPVFDDIREEVREKLATKRALDGMEENINALVERIRAGATSFAEAAKTAAVTVHPVSYIRRRDSISIAIDEDKASKATDDTAREKTETVPFREGIVVTTEAFNIAVDDSEKKVSSARDDRGGKYAVIRLDGPALDPDENGYQRWRNERYDNIVGARQATYFRRWKNSLRKTHDVRFRSVLVPEGLEEEPLGDTP